MVRDVSAAKDVDSSNMDCGTKVEADGNAFGPKIREKVRRTRSTVLRQSSPSSQYSPSLLRSQPELQLQRLGLPVCHGLIKHNLGRK
jgi:hypothetical protein